METIQNEPLNRCEEVLAHEGVKGMHWYIRRYQPYPSGYDGEGKFVGKRAARKAAKIEKRQARHQAKVKKKIENAVDTGNKKSLNKLRDEMSSEEYDAKYKELVDKGIDNAVKDRNTGSLKKFKEDMTPREYKHQKDRIEFKEAIDNDKNKKANKLLSKVDPEDVAEATNLIKSRVALQDQKLAKIRQDSELMAKMDKLNSGVGKVSKFASNVSSITSSFMDINKKVTEYSSAAKDAADKKEKSKLNKIIKSGDIAKIEEYKDKMDYNQLKEAYGKAYVMNSRAIDKAIADGNLNDVYKLMPWMNAEDMSKIITKIKNLESRGAAFSDDISYEDVLAHHGILGMHWGVRRFQPYPSDYSGDGKYIGKELKRAAKKEGFEGIRKHPKVQEAIDSDAYKEVRNKIVEMNKISFEADLAFSNADEAFDKVWDYEQNNYNEKTKDFLDAYDTTGELAPNSSKEFVKVVKEYDSLIKKYEALEKREKELNTEIINDINKITKDIVGDYGDIKVSGLNIPYGKTTLEKLVQETLKRGYLEKYDGPKSFIDRKKVK